MIQNAYTESSDAFNGTHSNTESQCLIWHELFPTKAVVSCCRLTPDQIPSCFPCNGVSVCLCVCCRIMSTVRRGRGLWFRGREIEKNSINERWVFRMATLEIFNWTVVRSFLVVFLLLTGRCYGAEICAILLLLRCPIAWHHYLP